MRISYAVFCVKEKEEKREQKEKKKIVKKRRVNEERWIEKRMWEGGEGRGKVWGRICVSARPCSRRISPGWGWGLSPMSRAPFRAPGRFAGTATASAVTDGSARRI